MTHGIAAALDPLPPANEGTGSNNSLLHSRWRGPSQTGTICGSLLMDTLNPSLSSSPAAARAAESRLEALLHAGGSDVLLKGSWGLEREGLRITPDGQPALTPHPFPPEEGDVTVDFAECQTELITTPLGSPEAAWTALHQLHRRLHGALGHELFWPLSLPGRWDQPGRFAPASFGGRPEWSAARAYREGLLRRHGRARQAISGVHFNLSFRPEFFAAWRAAQPSSAPERTLRDDAYFALMRNFLRHQHVFNALWGMSPPEDETFWQDLLRTTSAENRADAERCQDVISSVRLSPLGYGLATEIAAQVGVTYASVTEYREQLRAALTATDGRPALLAHEREFYSPVRPKPAATGDGAPGATLDQLARHGVGYLEFRVFDLDPFEPAGISLEALRFFHVFVLACLVLPSPALTTAEQATLADRWRWSTLCRGRLCECGHAPGDEVEVESLLSTLDAVAATLPATYAHAVSAARARWHGEATRVIDRWRDARAREPGGALALSLRLAREHHAAFST